jgi:hypothetical protein
MVFSVSNLTNNWWIEGGYDDGIYQLTINITSAGGSGSLIEGTFSGILLNRGYLSDIIPPKEVSVTGEFSFILGP